MQNLFQIWLGLLGWKPVWVVDDIDKARLEFRHTVWPVTVRVL